MEIESIKPFLAVAVSLVGAALIVAARRSPNIREGCSVVTAIVKFLIVVTMVPDILAGKTIHYSLLSLAPDIPIIEFRVDALGLVFAVTASFLWILTTFYSIGYMRALNEHAQTRYYLCFAITLSATMGVAFSSNLVTLYLFYELISFITYPLVAHKETEEALDRGNKYVFYLLMTSKGLLLASFMTYALSGTFDFKPHGILPSEANATLLTLTYVLFLVGIGKVAFMPLHAWLPAAMIAPTPVSALLHAVAVVNTGAFCVQRIMFHVFGVELMKALDLGVMTAVIASITIIGASIYALTRDNLKELLAYSTVSQLSYMVLGGALLSASGMKGGIMHLANHSFSKITLFFCAGSIYVASHKVNISEMHGIGRKVPWTMAAFAIGALSMIGIPPLAGYVSKHYLTTGATEASQSLIFYMLWVSTLLNAGYFLPILYKAYFQPARDHEHGHHEGGDHPGPQLIHEPSYFIVIPLVLCAVFTVLLGIYPKFLLDLIGQVVR